MCEPYGSAQVDRPTFSTPAIVRPGCDSDVGRGRAVIPICTRLSRSRCTPTETLQGVTTVAAFTYDSAGRLETVRGGVVTASYRYDRNGIGRRGEVPAGDAVPLDLRKPELDLVEPGAVGRGAHRALEVLLPAALSLAPALEPARQARYAIP